MTQRYCLLGVLVAVLMSSVAFADYAPIQLDTLGVNLRQGYHTEWYRAGAHDPSTGDKVYTWSDCRGGYRDVYAQKIDVNGNSQWGEGGKLICRNEGRQEDPEVIYSGSGNWIFAWVDYRNTPNVIEAGDVYAQKVDSNGDPLWDPAGVAVCTAEGVQISLRPVSDGAGGLLILWEDNRRGDGNDIFAQRITSAGQVAPGWPVNGDTVNAVVGRQEGLTVDSDGHGGAIVAWKDTRYAANSNIYAQRIRPNGDLVWNHDGLPLCELDFDQEAPKLCPSGDGGAYIVWIDKRFDHDFGDLYFQRVDSLGHLFYHPDSGQVLCDAEKEQSECRIMMADDGGAIFVWVDFRDDPQNIENDIYMQKVSPLGSLLWGYNGLPICMANNRQWGARFTTDGSSGTIVAWQDIRYGDDDEDADIYAQRVSAAGVPLWQTNGAPVCTTEGFQHSALLKPDLDHGAFIVWGDHRDGSMGLYTQHMNGNGQAQLTQNGVRFHFGIDGNTEDPLMVETNPGELLVLWKDFRFRNQACLFVQRVDTAGNIYLEDNGLPLCGGGADGYMDTPQFVSDSQNGALLVWKDSRSVNDYNQTFAQRLDSNGNPLWTQGGVHVYPLPLLDQKEQQHPYIAPDETGGAFVLWTQSNDSSALVYAQKLDANGIQVWNEPVQVSNGAVEDVCFGAVPDGDGGVITTWVGGLWPAFKVFAQKLDINGVPQWGFGGLLVCPADSNQEAARVIPDGSGGAIFAWKDKRRFGTDYNIALQRVDRSGNLMWSDSGLVICDAESDQDYITLEPDDEGNTYVSWQDFRNGTHQNIYIQKVSLSGEILLAHNGQAVTNGPWDGWYPEMVHDRDGGIYMAWEDYRVGDGTRTDIYGQHLNSQGGLAHPVWVANGNHINDALFWQLDPAIAPDGDGGAMVAWEDGRSSGKEQTYNLFIQHVTDYSTSPVIENREPVPVTFRLEQNFPNPFNPATRIRYGLSNVGRVKLVIYDILGRQVRILQNQVMNAGSHEVIWNGKTASGLMASSGIYFCRLEVEGKSKIRKMVMLK